MPRRLNTNDIKNLFEKYGYRVPDNFVYINNTTKYTVFDEQLQRTVRLNYKNLQYRIRTGRSEYQLPTFETEFANILLEDEAQNDADLSDIDQNETSQNKKTSFERWLNKRSETIQKRPKDDQKLIFNKTHELTKSLLKKQDFTIYFNNSNRLSIMHAFIEAAKIAGPKLGNINTRLTAVDSNGNLSYEHLQPNTINFLEDLFNDPDFENIPSYDQFENTIKDIVELRVEFIPRKTGTRKTAGFFPFINTTNIDLTRYGIFTNTNEDAINDGKTGSSPGSESCLVQSLKASGLVSDNDLNMIRSFMRTREIPLTILRDVCDLLKIHIYIQYDKPGEKQTNHQDYGIEYKQRGTIKLFILFNHFILNERTNVSKTYINRYNEINNDERFKSHPRKMLLSKFNEKSYSFSKEGITSIALIKLMLENGLLVPMSDKDISKILWSYKPKEESTNSFRLSRPVSIKPKKYKGNVKQGVHFFGYKPENDNIDERLRELQKVVDSLPLRNRVDVSYYYKFSELMQKIMYEYGCYDGVYEIAGDIAKSFRNQCIFPRTHTYNGKPLYLKQKMYYIDLNGAYMSCVESIPTGETGDGEQNTKIKELIRILYTIRKKSNPKLATTLKCMMTSCWGYSIRRPKTIKRKYAKNVNKLIDEMEQFVYKYSYENNGESGWISLIESFVPHFTIPQFAKSVLDTFRAKMDEVKSLVNVYYENIDAILIDENDYNKLLKLGYIGEELGKFKIEHVFNEIAVKTARKYVATLDDGTIFYHCVKDSVNYDDFVNEVKQMIE